MKKLLVLLWTMVISVFYTVAQTDYPLYLSDEKREELNRQHDSLKALRYYESQLIYAQANHYFDNGDYETAENLYEKVLEQRDTLSFLFFKKGFCEYNLGRHEESVVSFTECLSLIHKIKKKNQYWQERNVPMLIGEGEISTSPVGYSLEYKYAHCFLFRGVSKYALGDNTGAIQDLKTYHKEVSDSSYLTCNYMGSAMLAMKQYKTAIKYFTYTIDNAGKDASQLKTAYFNRAVCYQKLGNKTQTCKDLSRAGEWGNTEAYHHIKLYCNTDE